MSLIRNTFISKGWISPREVVQWGFILRDDQRSWPYHSVLLQLPTDGGYTLEIKFWLSITVIKWVVEPPFLHLSYLKTYLLAHGKKKRKENSHPYVINEPADLVNSLPGAFLPKDLLHLLPFVLTNFVISTLSLKYLAQTQKENLGIF